MAAEATCVDIREITWVKRLSISQGLQLTTFFRDYFYNESITKSSSLKNVRKERKESTYCLLHVLFIHLVPVGVSYVVLQLLL